ncbi:MAG: hypothetical protein WC738_04375 [Candidatus Omnitrophota bacterium]|jgi:hypothetical protein
MSFTRDWLEANPIDHTKFKVQPGGVRELKVDISDRLKDFLYGFVSAETDVGAKAIPFVSQGTADTGDTGTGIINLKAFTVSGKAEIFFIDEDGNLVQLTSVGKINAAALGGTMPATILQAIYEAVYPVGSIYFNAAGSTNPATLLGFGTWAAFGAGKTLVGIDPTDTDFDTVEETGGEKTHTLVIGESPAHVHGAWRTYGGSESHDKQIEQILTGGSGDETHFDDVTDSKGGDGAHNNLQPYIVVYMWKRTA